MNENRSVTARLRAWLVLLALASTLAACGGSHKNNDAAQQAELVWDQSHWDQSRWD